MYTTSGINVSRFSCALFNWLSITEAPSIPTIDSSIAGDTQNFDEEFLGMEPVLKVHEHTDRDRKTSMYSNEGEDSVTTPSEVAVDPFHGYSFESRHSMAAE